MLYRSLTAIAKLGRSAKHGTASFIASEIGRSL